MSRYHEPDDNGDGPPNQGDLWWANIRRHLRGPKGRAALLEIKAALEALPEKRLVEGALCRVRRQDAQPGDAIIVPVPEGQLGAFEEPQEGEKIAITMARPAVIEDAGVCMVGAYVIHKLQQQGLTRDEAIAKLDPTIVDALGQPIDEDYDEYDNDIEETAGVGVKYGLTKPMAWLLAYKNDEDYGGLTEEQRYERFLAYVNEKLSTHPTSVEP